MKTFITLLTFVLFTNISYSQGVGINETGSAPDESAILHVESESGTKGVLLPRLTTAERDGIVSPANGLLIYNTDTGCLNGFDEISSSWKDYCQSSSGCPPDMVSVNDVYCIESTQRPGGVHWFEAVDSCFTSGRRMCRWAEYYKACAYLNPPSFDVNGWEWLEDGGATNSARVVGGLGCITSQTNIPSSVARFRCCTDYR